MRGFFMDKLKRPNIYNDPTARLIGETLTTHPVWSFSLRYQDEARWDNWINDGFGNIQVVSLGTVGALNKEGEIIEPGFRLIASVAQLANTVEQMKKHGLSTPTPTILYPIYANASANKGNPEINLQYAFQHYLMAVLYFQIFHPDIPIPEALIDKPEGMDELLQKAPLILPYMQQHNMEKLVAMARKFYREEESEEMVIRSLAYLLPHFFVYGFARNVKYLDNGKKRIMLMPQSEAMFTDLLMEEYNAVEKAIPLKPLTDDETGDTIVVYSDILTSPPYFTNKKEPTLMQIRNRFPTMKNLQGMNGLAAKEVLRAVQILEKDTGGKIDDLFALVINPYIEAVSNLQHSM
jgi:hypothetical protein